MSDDLDYELPDEVVADQPHHRKALSDPTRLLVLDLVLERAMTVSELAERCGKAKGTIAHHVDVLVEAGLLRVVRTQRVRAVEERSYGRTGRTIMMGSIGDGPAPFLTQALAEIADDDEHDRFTLRHARIPADRAAEFWARVEDLAVEFTRLPRAGDVEHGFVAGVYRTNRLPTRPTKKRS